MLCHSTANCSGSGHWSVPPKLSATTFIQIFNYNGGVNHRIDKTQMLLQFGSSVYVICALTTEYQECNAGFSSQPPSLPGSSIWASVQGGTSGMALVGRVAVTAHP